MLLNCAVALAFFPAMGLPAARKLELVDQIFRGLTRRFQVVTMKEQARRIANGDQGRRVRPSFPAVGSGEMGGSRIP